MKTPRPSPLPSKNNGLDADLALFMKAHVAWLKRNLTLLEQMHEFDSHFPTLRQLNRSEIHHIKTAIHVFELLLATTPTN
jgi:hypothetical protein